MERHHAGWCTHEDLEERCALSVTTSRALRVQVRTEDVPEILRTMAARASQVQLGSIGAFEVCPDPRPQVGWGFGSALRNRPAPEGSTVWTCTLPTVPGHRSEGYADCRAAHASVALLLDAAGSCGTVPTAGRSQLLMPHAFSVTETLQGAEFIACLSPRLCRWIAANRDRRAIAEPITRTMRWVHHRLFPVAPIPSETGFTWLGENQFTLRCLGDACDLTVMPEDLDGFEHGVVLNPHNVDSSFQALSLLWGLAALYQVARDSGA